MGLDMWMAPVVLDSAPMRAMQDSAAIFEEAGWRPPFSCLRDEPLPDVNRELMELLPDGFREPISPFPRRSHEQAEYLIDPAARRRIRSWEERERSMPYRIVHGDRPMTEHMRATQGIPWRCSTAGFLAGAAARIDAIDAAEVRREFSVAEMFERGVYKVSPAEDDDESFIAALAELHRLSDYHHRLVDKGLDLVVILD